MCAACDHPDRLDIETALERGEPPYRIATRHGIAASSVRAHREDDHKTKRPLTEEQKKPKEQRPASVVATPFTGPPSERESWPSVEEIKNMKEPGQRAGLVFRYLSERKYKGASTVAFLAKLWRKDLGNHAEEKVAEMVAHAAIKHRRLRGSRDMKREELVIEAHDLYRKAKLAGKFDSALGTLRFIAELDGITYEPGMLSALVEAQTWRLVKPLIEKENPGLMDRIVRLMAGADRKRQKAIKTLEEGPEAEGDPVAMLGQGEETDEVSSRIDARGGEGEGAVEEGSTER